MRRLSLAEVEAARDARGRSILLFLTDRCPVGCLHCSVDSRRDSPTIRDFPLFETIVEALCARNEVTMIGISGGEPFVERRGLTHAAHHVADAGKDLVLYTSGFWASRAESPPWIREVIGLAGCIFLSTDAFHAAALADERFEQAARTIAAQDVPIVVQVLDDSPMVERAEGLLATALGDGWRDVAEINLIPPLPYGRGAQVFRHAPPQPGRAFHRCRVVAASVVRYDGRMSGCCNENVIMGGGPDLLRRRCATSEEVHDALDHFGVDPLLGAIGGIGPGLLTEHPRFRDLADQEFKSICDLCWTMLERTEGDEHADPLISALELAGRSVA